MSYRLGKKKRSEPCKSSVKVLPSHQDMCLRRAIEAGRKHKPRSIRSLRREALRSATALRVKAENSIIKSRGLQGKHLSDKDRKMLFRKLKEPWEIAYSKNRELFSYHG